jgi:hypothetical protein
MKMKKLFVSTLLTAMAVPVMMFAQTPAPSTDSKPTSTTKSTTKAKKQHAKKTTAAPAAASTGKTASPAPKN